MNKQLLLISILFFNQIYLHAQCEDPVYQHQSWRPVQQKARDSVVQIFAQRAPIDILHPWAPPTQMAARGSGFFITESGELLTNYHVVDQAVMIWVQIPSLGKRPIPVDLVGVCPERDVALLRIAQADLEFIKEQLGGIAPLPLGDSDCVTRTDEVLAMGYPLGQESLKSTTGVISGREQQWIQMDAAINPGSSGGPLLNMHGEVIGINSAGRPDAQNVGYIIPINNIKVILSDLHKKKFIYKPFLGIYSIMITDDVTDYLGNPQPGGCFITQVVKDSPADKAGIQSGDMLYEINGYRLDIFGEITVSWSEDKISVIDYISRLELGQRIDLVVYRKGERHDLNVSFDHSDLLPIRYVYPDFEELDYEIFGGMAIMELTLNHVRELMQYAPGLASFGDVKNQQESALVVTHIFSSSSLYRARTFSPGAIIHEVNGKKVKTLHEFRDAVKEGANGTYFVVRAADKVHNLTDNLLVVLPYQRILAEEVQLSRYYHYPLSDLTKELIDRLTTDELLAP